MKLNVEVTAEDIAAGEPKSCYRCPAALAISRHVQIRFPGRRWRVTVGDTSATADTDDGISPRLFYQITGETLAPFVKRVDNGRDPQPVTLPLEFERWPTEG